MMSNQMFFMLVICALLVLDAFIETWKGFK
nr:MAG TPA: hypothetical protein [Caudoviricetes sp.]